jgi:isopenicillin N synthase-like dioxygenase
MASIIYLVVAQIAVMATLTSSSNRIHGLSSGSFPATPCGVQQYIDVTPLLEPSAAAPFAEAVQQTGAALCQAGCGLGSGKFPTTPCGVQHYIDVTPLLEPSAAAPLAAAVQQTGAALCQAGCGLCSGNFPTTPCGIHPLIDVTPLLEPSAAAPFAAAVQQIGAALREVGWFYAAGVSVLPPDYIRGIYSYLGKAHALSAAEKYKYRQRGGLGSYSGPDVGEPELKYDESDAYPTVRGWSYSRIRFSLGDASGISLDERYPPAEVLSPSFAPTMEELYGRQDVLGRALMRGLEAALKLPNDTLLGRFEGGDFGTIRLLHYPAVNNSQGDEAAAVNKGIVVEATGSADKAGGLEIGIGPHTDLEVVTMIHQDAPGLQFMRRAPSGIGHAKEWFDAPVSLEADVSMRPSIYEGTGLGLGGGLHGRGKGRDGRENR